VLLVSVPVLVPPGWAMVIVFTLCAVTSLMNCV
jgi:hypothetical protein